MLLFTKFRSWPNCQHTPQITVNFLPLRKIDQLVKKVRVCTIFVEIFSNGRLAARGEVSEQQKQAELKTYGCTFSFFSNTSYFTCADVLCRTFWGRFLFKMKFFVRNFTNKTQKIENEWAYCTSVLELCCLSVDVHLSWKLQAAHNLRLNMFRILPVIL